MVTKQLDENERDVLSLILAKNHMVTKHFSGLSIV